MKTPLGPLLTSSMLRKVLRKMSTISVPNGAARLSTFHTVLQPRLLMTCRLEKQVAARQQLLVELLFGKWSVNAITVIQTDSRWRSLRTVTIIGRSGTGVQRPI